MAVPTAGIMDNIATEMGYTKVKPIRLKEAVRKPMKINEKYSKHREAIHAWRTRGRASWTAPACASGETRR